MVAARLVDPRNGRPSMRQLAVAAGTTTSTISAMMHGTRATQNDVVERVAVALKMQDRVDEVMSWVDRERTQVHPFDPHPDANLLTTDEQEAINEIIRLMALPKKRGGGDRGISSAPIGAPDSGPGNIFSMPKSKAARHTGRRGGADDSDDS